MLLSEVKLDQAAGLRKIAKPDPVRVISVTSGKGGVGKTNVSVNLSVALSEAGNNVMLLDADLAMANVDVLLGVHSKHNLSHVISGDRTLEEIIVRGPSDVMIVPAASGVKRLSELTTMEHAGLIRAFSELTDPIDTLVIDTPAGINESVVSFSRAAQEVLVVVCDEPASITDAYALIKVLSRDYGIQHFRVLANMADSVQESNELFKKLTRVTNRYLDVTLEYMGSIPQDEFLKKAVKKQRAVVQAFPRSRSAMAFRGISKKIHRWPVPSVAGGHLEFFVERLIQSRHSLMEVSA
ncbi:MAG: MinD/ParA family protein [Gammaproteobacteria bacterium]